MEFYDPKEETRTAERRKLLLVKVLAVSVGSTGVSLASGTMRPAFEAGAAYVDDMDGRVERASERNRHLRAAAEVPAPWVPNAYATLGGAYEGVTHTVKTADSVVGKTTAVLGVVGNAGAGVAGAVNKILKKSVPSSDKTSWEEQLSQPGNGHTRG